MINLSSTHTVESTVQVPSILSGGNAVDISAGNNLTTLASQVNSGGDVNLSAGGKIDYLAALNIKRNEEDSKTSRSFAGIGIGSSRRNDSLTTVKAAPTQLQSESDILSASGGDTRVQGTQIKAGGSLTATAGVGPKADPNARILIEGVKEKTIESHTEQNESLVWQSTSGHGSSQESLALVKIEAKETSFSAPGGISVQLPASDHFRQQIEALQQEPGMGWLGDMAQRKDVNWSQVKLAYDSWSYSQQGLSQTGAILIAIAVAAVTYGTASNLSAGLMASAGMTTTAGAVGASTVAVGTAGTVLTTGGAMLSASLTAGMSSLASQAAVALINNQGDIGKTLQTLGSESSIRNTVATMVTAGTLQGLGDALGFSQNAAYSGMSGNGSLTTSTSGVATSQLVNQFGSNLSKNLVNNLTGTLINSAITGQPLNEQSLQNALTSALITTGIAQGANDIGKAASKGPNGEAPAINGFTQAVAHVVLGCAGGAAAAGNGSGCGAGAIGAVVGELTAKFASDANMSPDSAVVLAKVMSATAGLLVSGGDATQVNVAATMGMNAAVNNALSQKQAIILKQAIKDCAGEATCTNNVVYNAILLSNAQGNGIERSNAQQAITVLTQLAGDPNVVLTPENRNAIAILAGKNVLDYATTTSSSTAADQSTVSKDKLTGVALDSTGRYSVSAVVDGEVYKPKYFPCATVACLNSASNLDMSDAGTQAYVNALDAQVFKDIGKGMTMGTLVTPTGVPGTVLTVLGLLASGGQAGISNDAVATGRDELLKTLSEKGGEVFFREILGHTPSNAIRISALLNLAGGWDAFVNRVKIDWLGVKAK